MIRPGLISVTFRQLSAGEVVDLASQAGLDGIEWGGDVHVPHGNIQIARQVRRMTEDAGLQVTSYGSYYHAGQSQGAGPSFESVLETATTLGSPMIRVWAGSRRSIDADKQYWDRVISDTRRIADIAGAAGVGISYEFHEDTLADTGKSTQRLLKEVAHDNVTACWQPIPEISVEENLKALEVVLPGLSNVHIFHWRPISRQRCLLSAGLDDWRQYLKKVASTGRDHFALIEFVKEDAPDNFLTDAQTLKQLLSELERGTR